ncbi:hypothetical protein B0H13DRAFT_2268177 [Mycena leptocephala]|nr:hypothetical protein B0H13DRAFT_2268177 [Mycena leptocephala]
MPSLVQMMTGAVEARAQQLAIECPVLSVDFWDKIETAPVETKEDYFLAGRQFLATSMKDYASTRAFRMPVGSYDVIQDELFSARTFTLILKRANIEVAEGSSAGIYKAFMLFLGAALQELDEGELKSWFSATFVPLISVAENAFIDYYAPPAGASATNAFEEEEGRLKKRARIESSYAGCTGPLNSIRTKQPRVQRHARLKRSPNSQASSTKRPRGFISKLASAAKKFATKDLPAFLSESIFGPPLVLPSGPFTAHADLALHLAARSSAPSTAAFAPALGFVPARLPVPSQDIDARIFQEIHEAYQRLEAISRFPPLPFPFALSSLPSTPSTFGLAPGTMASGSTFAVYRDPSPHNF